MAQPSSIQRPFSHVGDVSTRYKLTNHTPEFLSTYTGWRTFELRGDFNDLSVCPPTPPPSPSSSSFPLSNATKNAGNANQPTGRPVNPSAADCRYGVQASSNGLPKEPIIAVRITGGISPDFNSTLFTGRYPSVDNLAAPAQNHTNLQNNKSTIAVTGLSKGIGAELDGEANADLLAHLLLKVSLEMHSIGRAPDFRWNGKGRAVPNREEQYDHGCVDEHRSMQCGMRGRRSDVDDVVWWKH